MPLLSRLGLGVELTSALASLTPPVSTVEALLERDVDALQRDTGFPRASIVAFRCLAAERFLARREGCGARCEKAFCGPGGVVSSFASTGLCEVDGILGGGFVKGGVTEVEGPSGSGKTLVLTVAAAAAAARGEDVLFVNAGGAAPLDAAKVDAWCRALGSADGAALDRVRSVDVFDAAELLLALDEAAKEGAKFPRPGGAVFVDAPAAVLLPNLGGDRNAGGHQRVALAGHALNNLAAARGLAVVVANGTSRAAPDDDDAGGRAFGEAWRGALGRSWSFVPAARVSLAARSDDGTFACALAKHPSLPADPAVHRRFAAPCPSREW